MKLIHKITILTIILIASSCKKQQITTSAKNHFFLENAGAVMPIFVNGNTKSKVFIVYLHGGPGSTSLEAYQNKNNPLTNLQKDYGVVYWDQRCAGASQGSCNNLTLKQYNEDLEKLILLLQNKYGSDIKFFLLGHSWGGSLGIKYLSTATNQAKIKGWIEVGGGHNVPKIVRLEKEMVTEIGNRQIAAGKNATEWKSKIDKSNTLNLNVVDDVYEMNRIAVAAEGLIRKVDSVNEKITNSWVYDYFFNPLESALSSSNQNASFEGMKNELAILNLSDSLPKITIPTLLLWGKYDFRVPPKFAQEELQKYGSTKKQLFVFDRSAHFVQFNESQLFFDKVKNFIEENK
jgi:pimeloyl-ACP methyl ester carboxylesterase